MVILALIAAVVRPPIAGDTSFRMARNRSVEISTQTRDITVRVGGGDMITIRNGQVSTDGGSVEVTGSELRGRSGGSVEVTLPSWCRLEVSSIGGSIILIGSPERASVETVNGAVRVENGSGRLELQSVAGAVTVNGFNGSRLSIDATNQPIVVNNATGELHLENVNESITLHGIHSVLVRAETVNGRIEYSGDYQPAGSYEFTSQNSDVRLIVAGEFNARVRVTTMNGSLISPDLPARTNGSGGGSVNSTANGDKRTSRHHDTDDGDEKSFTATYGNGGASITVDVFNGNAVVRRAGGRP